MPHKDTQRRQTDVGHDQETAIGEEAQHDGSGDRPKQLLSRDDIQDQYGLSRRWLEIAAVAGNGPAFIKISPRMVRYRRDTFERWLAERTMNSTSEIEVQS